MDIRSMLLGFIVGIIFVLFVITLTLYVTNKRFLKKSLQSHHIDNEEIKQLISSKQKKIVKSTKVGLNSNFTLMQQLTKELVFDIASYYYPESKTPQLEISFIEALDLNQRVNERLRGIMDNKAFGFLKNIRISQIIAILEFKKGIESNKVYQFSKKYKLDKVALYGYTALNIANPAYWVRRLALTSTLETSLRSIGVMTLNIVGEESSQLYSKKIIENRDKILDKELQKFIKEIELSTNN